MAWSSYALVSPNGHALFWAYPYCKLYYFSYLYCKFLYFANTYCKIWYFAIPHCQFWYFAYTFGKCDFMIMNKSKFCRLTLSLCMCLLEFHIVNSDNLSKVCRFNAFIVYVHVEISYCKFWYFAYTVGKCDFMIMKKSKFCWFNAFIMYLHVGIWNWYGVVYEEWILCCILWTQCDMVYNLLEFQLKQMWYMMWSIDLKYSIKNHVTFTALNRNVM